MRKVSQDFLKNKITQKYGKPKWVEFCETLLNEGYKLFLYESKTTRSKYIYVNGVYKVRFSNHKPTLRKQIECDSHFYVGVSHLGVTTTQDALMAVRKRFKNGA